MSVKEHLLTLELPVIAAPMFLVSGQELVVEGCKAGVATTFPLLNARTSEILETWFQHIKSELDGVEHAAPWGVNLVVHKSNVRYEEDVALIQKYQPPIVITSLGKPTDIAKVVHEYGGVVFSDVINIKHAKKAAEAGIDGLILVCNGAGGHSGTLNPFAFVNEVKQWFDGLIILSGSLSTGQDVFAAKALGADLAYMGTRFIATEEALANDDYKQMLVDSNAADIYYTDKVSGIPANFLLPSLQKAGKLAAEVEAPKELSMTEEAKAWKDIWSAGHGVGSIQEIIPVKTLVDQLKSEYNASFEKITNSKIRV